VGVITRYKLDGGTNSAAARRILPPEGLIRRAVNFRLRRDNELEQRPGFTALASSLYASILTVRIHDLVNYDGRLFGFGSNSQQATANVLGFFEYVGEFKAWRQIDKGKSLPLATDIRDLASPADIEQGVRTATCAVNDDICVFAFDAGNTSTAAFATVFRPSDGAVLLRLDLSSLLRPISLLLASGLFVIVGNNAVGTALRARSFNAASDNTISATSTLYTVDTFVFAAGAVLGSPGGFVTVGQLAGDLVIRHYNDSFVQQMTVTKAGLASNYLSIAANGPQNRITVLYGASGATVKALTINLATGATVTGPTAVFTNTTTGLHSVLYQDAVSATFRILVDVTSVTPRAVGIAQSDDAHVGLNQTLTSGVGSGSCYLSAQLSSEVLSVDPIGQGFTSGFGFLAGGTDQKVNALGTLGEVHFFKDFGTAIASSKRLGSHVRDAVTGKYYLVTMAANNDGEETAFVTEYRGGGIRRRQTAVIGGLLYIANGLPLVTDGYAAHEISWGEAPEFLTLTSSGAGGSVTSSARYFIQCCAEYVDSRKNSHLGPPSTVQDITTGAADNRITGTISGLHSLRKAVSGSGDSGSFRLVFFRTAALADLSAGELLFRESQTSIPLSDDFGDTFAFTLTLSDAQLRAIGTTIYTQSQTPVPNQAPPPCRFVWPLNDRLGAAGLPRAEQILESKLVFPGEAVAFTDSDLVQYQYRASEDVRGIARLGSNRVAFTRNEIHLWQGEGPDFSGLGEFSYAACLSSEGGLVDTDGWRSLCETDEGTFFQREFDQICLLQKGGSVDRKVGEAVRDELVTYPVVVATAFLRRSHHVAFAIQNAAGDAGEILVYDLRRKVWFVDDVGVVDALCEYQGRLVYCTRAGAVFQQDALPGTGSMPTQVLDTYDFDFGSGQSWGRSLNAGMVGEYQGDATLALSITYDSGLSYTAIGSWAITAANGYSAGKLFSEKKAIPDPKCALFGLRWQISGSSGSAGLRINEVTLETETAPGMQRLPARDTQ
jgi:hypothetical protein